MPLDIQPIGAVHKRPNGESELELTPDLVPGLLGIEPGQWVDVLFWLHELKPESRRVLQCHPRGDKARPLKGVFALRSPMRPNPIGVTSAQVVRVEGNRVHVRGLDAKDGSPVVDIKYCVRPPTS